MLVIARTEALIAGLGTAEAVRRGLAYAAAGADAVLVHSKQKTPQEILGFCEKWPDVGSVMRVADEEGRIVDVRIPPLVIVPTSYPQLSFAEVARLNKVGLIICGNHAVRAAVMGMRKAFAKIAREGGIAAVDADIASVNEVFELQGDRQMRDLEMEFLR
jgi:2-methylisocitrate lyase-like PEP mutase family enzyme